MLRLDHLVLGAISLAQGQEYLQDLLGVKVPNGGAHERFGTHNALMQLNGGAYFEIIAVDAQVQPTHQPRWFSLDEQSTQSQLRQQPRLLTWVVNTTELESLALLASQSTPAAEIVAMRRGALNWKMLIPPSGRYSDGLLPWALQWPQHGHPAANMAERGCRLVSLEAWHNDPTGFSELLAAIGADSLVDIKNAQKNNNNQQLKATLQCNGREAVFDGLLLS